MLKDIDAMVRLTDGSDKVNIIAVTVKTRLGWDEKFKNIEEVAEQLTGYWRIKGLAIHAEEQGRNFTKAKLTGH